MDLLGIDGVILTSLKRIRHPKGDVYHAMKKSDPGFSGFGEAYFSTVNPGDTKGWKKHVQMTMNLVVPVGAIRFVLFDDREGSTTKGTYQDVCISGENYQRLTVPPGVWMGFRGLGDSLNLLLNLANLEHDPAESENIPLENIQFSWEKV